MGAFARTRRATARSCGSTTGAEPAWSAPVVDATTVYVGVGNHDNRDGKRHLYALDAASGAELWRFEAPGRILDAPAIGGGRVFVLTIGGELYALG